MPVGQVPQVLPVLAKVLAQQLGVRVGELPHRSETQPLQPLAGVWPYTRDAPNW